MLADGPKYGAESKKEEEEQALRDRINAIKRG